ncbi:MAG TPA: hypothetical protein VNO24_10280 [Blastocatellia bacterium]|nr:hypothetical protein [Blastocatellia bacterium]
MAKNPGMFTKANADRFCSNVDKPDEDHCREVERFVYSAQDALQEHE